MLGVDELGCGYEMPLEATYRFLVDPEPYEALVEEDGLLVESGVDQAILEQRAAFVRPDSFLGIVLLSDEDDCSLDPMTQGAAAAGCAVLPRERRAPRTPTTRAAPAAGWPCPKVAGRTPRATSPCTGPRPTTPT